MTEERTPYGDQSDTPRTDAQADRYGPQVPMSNIVTADFARQLERELAEARKDAERYRAGYEAAIAFVDSNVADPDITPEMCETYAALKAQRAAIDLAMSPPAAP
jgi:hypothetical protein